MSNNLGKIPPQSTDLEEVVLGAMMVDSKCIDEVMEILSKECFYKEPHSLIFEAIQQLFNEREPIDLLTVSQRLRRNSNLETAGGDYRLIELTQKVSSSAHIEYHCRIIAQNKLKRDLIKFSAMVAEGAFDETVDVFELLNNTYNDLNELSQIISKSTETKVGDVISERINKAVKIFKGEVKAGIDTPFEKINKATGGWRDSELYIIAARPGMGKTSYVLKSAVHAANQGIPTALFSLEMAAAKLTDRILSIEGEVDSDKFNTKGLSPDDVAKLLPIKQKLEEIPLYIDDSSSLGVNNLRIKAKRMVRTHGIKMICIDYLQLMTQKAGTREQEISKISRGLKELAMELNVPVIALSQLSRAVETRGGSKRPFLSDLRDSGAIEQDADVVMFVYRPEYYGIEEWDDEERSPTHQQAEIIYAKNRNGGLISTRLKFEGRYTAFKDLEDFIEVPALPFVDVNQAFISEDDDTPF